MKVQSLFLATGVAVCASVIVVLGACSTGETNPAEPDVVEDVVPAPDGGADATPENDDAGVCADCMHFTQTCSDDVLCMNGPFDPDTPGGSLDARIQINVIRGRSANDVWAAGALGSIAHFDGTSWKRSDPGVRSSMRALWLRDSGEVSLSSLDAVYTRNLGPQEAGGDAAPPSDGGWIYYGTPAAPADYVSTEMTFSSAWAAPGAGWLWCATKSRGWSGLWRLRLVPSTNGFEIGKGVPSGSCGRLPCRKMLSIHGTSPESLWAVGYTGATIRVTDADGDTPNLTAFNSQTQNALHGVWMASESEAWSVGEGGVIRHYTGDPILWDVVPDVPQSWNLNAIWGSSASDIWAVGDAAVVIHYDGKSWSRMKVAGLGARRPNLTAVWTSTPGHVWIGGEGVMLSLGGKP